MFAKLIPMFLKGDFSQVPPDMLDTVNRMLVSDFTEQYAGLLRVLSDPANRPLVFHCTQGKDRAGFGAAMVLSALGVPWETVVEDYLLSNHFRKEENDKMLGMIRSFAASHAGPEGEEVAFSRVEGLLYVKEQSLQAAHAEIIERHGSVEVFLTRAARLFRRGVSSGCATICWSRTCTKREKVLVGVCVGRGVRARRWLRCAARGGGRERRSFGTRRLHREAPRSVRSSRPGAGVSARRPKVAWSSGTTRVAARATSGTSYARCARGRWTPRASRRLGSASSCVLRWCFRRRA